MATYLAYAKRAKFANTTTVTSFLLTLKYMGNCVMELYSLDYASSYQHAFEKCETKPIIGSRLYLREFFIFRI